MKTISKTFLLLFFLAGCQKGTSEYLIDTMKIRLWLDGIPGLFLSDSTYKRAYIRLSFLGEKGEDAPLAFAFPVGKIDSLNISLFVKENNTLKYVKKINSYFTYKLFYPADYGFFDKQEVTGNLADLPEQKPYCSDEMHLYFIEFPDTHEYQYYLFEYYDNTGNYLKDTLPVIYIK